MEINWPWGRLLVLTLTPNFVKHRHVVVLVLHAGPGLALLVELLLLADPAGLRSLKAEFDRVRDPAAVQALFDAFLAGGGLQSLPLRGI